MSKLEDEFESMSEVINCYVEMSRNKDNGAGNKKAVFKRQQLILCQSQDQSRGMRGLSGTAWCSMAWMWTTWSG